MLQWSSKRFKWLCIRIQIDKWTLINVGQKIVRIRDCSKQGNHKPTPTYPHLNKKQVNRVQMQPEIREMTGSHWLTFLPNRCCLLRKWQFVKGGQWLVRIINHGSNECFRLGKYSSLSQLSSWTEFTLMEWGTAYQQPRETPAPKEQQIVGRRYLIGLAAYR